MKHTLSVLVEDEAGVLTRIAGLFARRGFNIESLAVGQAEQNGVSRITMVVPGDDRVIEQLTKQLYKLIHVLKVQDITEVPCVERELMLIKVSATSSNRSEVIEIAQIFRARVVDVAEDSLTLEVVGDPGKIVAIVQLLQKFGLREVARTGKIALVRESGVNTEYLKSQVEAKVLWVRLKSSTRRNSPAIVGCGRGQVDREVKHQEERHGLPLLLTDRVLSSCL